MSRRVSLSGMRRGVPTRQRRRAALASVLAVLCAGFGGREPGGGSVDEARAAAAAAGASERCRGEVEASLRSGARPGRSRCGGEVDAAATRLIQGARGRVAFGIVERETVRLSGVSFVLSVARRCERWPLRSQGQAALDIGAAEAASCRVRRYEGPLAVAVRRRDGAVEPVMSMKVGQNGQIEVTFAEIEASLRAQRRPGLADAAAVLFGAGAWAGHVEMEALGREAASWHASWVSRGRGLPALFGSLHPEHPASATMRVLALEAALRRQAADAEAVRRGTLSRRRFLERHAWSPYRSLVEER